MNICSRLSYLSGISDLWFLSMQLFLRHLVHEKPERGFGSDIDGTESFGLSVDPIFIELDFDEVCHADAGHTVRDVGVSCPPCQVSNVSLNKYKKTLRSKLLKDLNS